MQARDDWTKKVKTSIRGPVIAALLIVGFGFGGFLYWAATAQLAGAVIAAGHVAAQGENQIIQHREGGIVTRIAVKEGDQVTAGQSLVTLDPTLVEANVNRARKLLATLHAEEARLLAELHDRDEIALPPELLGEALDPALKDFIESKKTEFEQRRQRYRNEIRILEQRLAGLHEEIAGNVAQRDATGTQTVLIREELKDLNYLFERGLSRQDKVFAMQRAEAELLGKDGALQAAIGKAKQSIAEVQQQIEKLGHDRKSEASTKLSEARMRIADTLEQIVGYEDILSRIVIRAPVDGTIVKLNVNTVGAVIAEGQAIAELLPADAALVVEARLRPADIDAVEIGGPANVRLAALNQRTTPVVPSHVLYVSADKLTDQQTQETYYGVRLALELDKLETHERLRLEPGMPADVFITTSERTMLRYLYRPIEDSLAKAFREE